MLKVMFGSEPYCIDKAIEGMKKEISFTEMNVSCFDSLPSEAEALCRTRSGNDSCNWEKYTDCRDTAKFQYYISGI